MAVRAASMLMVLLAAAVGRCGTPGVDSPRVWIFSGHPGDEEHRELFSQCQSDLRDVLTQQYEVAIDSCRGLSDTACSRPALEAELNAVAAASLSPQPVWLFFLGHANATADGANYNLHGPDISARHLGGLLRRVNGPAPLVVFFTTSSSGAFLRPLARPGRVVVTATMPRGETNETFFPHELVAALRDPTTDGDGDGAVNVLELFRQTKQRVAQRFATEELAQTEHALLDGTGDGVGAIDPVGAEAEAAGQARLLLRVPVASSPPPGNPRAPAKTDEDDDWDW